MTQTCSNCAHWARVSKTREPLQFCVKRNYDLKPGCAHTKENDTCEDWVEDKRVKT